MFQNVRNDRFLTNVLRKQVDHMRLAAFKQNPRKYLSSVPLDWIVCIRIIASQLLPGTSHACSMVGNNCDNLMFSQFDYLLSEKISNEIPCTK
uniref:Uncharacterized protein n=1 Tax=Ditylenchus dipsaci TaxID=166011 RepID=A0A915EE71_9BILA